MIQRVPLNTVVISQLLVQSLELVFSGDVASIGSDVDDYDLLGGTQPKTSWTELA